ncbi:jg17272 [Pararge aegeria aegeria]|uniref:Jg17272 protein n=2 Tax=Pararge aegeria TaxID=116150 RepID=A0A8S4SKP0_9NEOP|nr:jg17272 [Pararge aegeria aegeria]
MEVGKRNINEVCLALRSLIERVCDAEKKLQSSPANFNIQSVSIEEHLQIPPLPDLSGLKMNQNQYHINFDTFTPLNISKHRFNLNRRGEVFSRPQPKSILTTYHAPKDDFLKTLLSCRVSSYDRVNVNQSCNMSIISNIKANETIAECSSGFTRQQITRLLSTNKKSSNKKRKNKQEHHDNVKFKKGCLFNESMVSNDSHGLVRSYSSPNLLENRESRIPIAMIRGRKLSIMQEDSPPHMDLSGITCLNSFNTPTGLDNAEIAKNTFNFQKNNDEIKKRLDSIQKEFESAISPILEQETHFSKAMTARDLHENHFPNVVAARELKETHLPKPVKARELPLITMTPVTEQEKRFSKEHTARVQGSHLPKPVTSRELPIITKISVRKPETLSSKADTVRELQGTHFSKTIVARDSPKNSISPIINEESQSKIETPKNNNALIKKTSSLEKIINRFKQLRSTSITFKDEDINTIVEEKENFNINSGLNANRNLLPDLLSPSCSLLNVRSNSDNVNYFDTDEVEIHRNPRVSLGTMLGVDHTFLDQFDLID